MTAEPLTEERAPEKRRRPRRRPRRRTVLALGAVVAAGAAAVATFGFGGGDGKGGARAAGLPPNTTKVTKQTLKDSETADGSLGYGQAAAASARAAGTVTALPDTGDRITRGKELYEVDSRPVVLMYGAKPAYRTLSAGMEGKDVLWLERNLRALGYDGFTVDDEYTSDTADAVAEWQDDVGLAETGNVELGSVVFAPGAVRVDGLQAGVGDAVTPGRKILTYTGTDKAVTVELESDDLRLAREGAAVDVELPDGSVARGVVDEVTTVIEPAAQGQDPKTKVEVTVALKGDKAQKAAARYVLAAVDVTFTAGTRKDVLTVPVAALVALSEGGFGVEVVSGGTSSYVPVKVGLFAGGKVEVSGAGIAEGTVVGVPK
ncbi:peptidoglycan-binding protein [Actinomadura kijaniata]|uniref:Peptidoglycan binding-like domain-containing protein n=1 Tax=Actinomadura namibiensis TaxID=182080 RepID=A0A7W3LM86_ACTNM|nr:peptidoglycan-binding protein [Actinomadura namibiensis]MBA8950736.1 hypothetical protein [Actinomadura namibiensis]